ncbi:MAG: amidohydrolase [Egibacteraceae bacterium]
MLDLQLHNANVITMDPARPAARTVGLWNGQIAGLDEAVTGLRARRSIDLAGATVLPGFVDAHAHLCWAGLASRCIDVSSCDRIDRVLETIDAAVRRAPPGAWVEVAGYDQRPLGRHITCADLDTVSAGRRVYLQHRSGHACVVSSEVLELLPDEARSGSGLLVERAMLMARQLRMPYEIDEIVDAIEHSAHRCLSEGITMCAEAGIGGGLIGHSPAELAAYQAARDQGRLPIRMQVMVASDVIHPVSAHERDGIRRGLDLGLRTGLGDDRLSIGALKVFADGGMMARTAALTSPYVGGDDCGLLQDDPEALARVIVDGHAAGWQLAVHAIGDQAVDVTLDALARAQRARPRQDARHRVEHCGLTRPDQLDRLARVGAIAVVQPAFLWDYGDDYAAIVGPDRAEWLYRGRGFANHGILVAGSSDRPVATAAPLRGIQFMVERRSNTGQTIGPQEHLPVTQALKAYTHNAAFACRREQSVGSLCPGKRADLVVLAEDPRQADPSRIADIEVIATLVDGKIAYGALE